MLVLLGPHNPISNNINIKLLITPDKINSVTTNCSIWDGEQFMLGTPTIIVLSLLYLLLLFLFLCPRLHDLPQSWRLGVLSTDIILLFSEPNSQRTMCVLHILNYSWNICPSSRPCSSEQKTLLSPGNVKESKSELPLWARSIFPI